MATVTSAADRIKQLKQASADYDRASMQLGLMFNGKGPSELPAAAEQRLRRHYAKVMLDSLKTLWQG